MGVLADLLDALVVTVSSPDGQITAVLRNRRELDVSFVDGGYRKYTERSLEHQLSRLLVSLWNEHRRGCDAALAEALGHPVEKPRESWDTNERRFKAERVETVAEGMSRQKCIFMRTTALMSWDVVVRDGTLIKLDEAEFTADLLSAYRVLYPNYHAKLAELRAKHLTSALSKYSEPPARRR